MIPGVVALAGGDPEAIRGEHGSAAAAAGEESANAVLEVFGRWVALGLANLATLLDPEVFVIGGGLVEIGELLLAPVRLAFAELLFGSEVRRDIRIVEAQLGPRAGSVGAALLGAAVGTN
jgi:glucokinase